MQGNGSVMAAAIESGNPIFWAGYGIPSTPGQMVGANAIIVKPCSSCPTGAPQYPSPFSTLSIFWLCSISRGCAA